VRAPFELWWGRRLFKDARGKRIATVFGSARCTSDSPFYQVGVHTGAALARAQWVTLTGGGPGVMEAANKGAFEAGGHSLGCNITLPFEQNANPYLHRVFTCDYFFTRKFLLIAFSDAFIFLPGGLGTLDEFFEVVTLLQTNKVPPLPVILVGREFWAPLTDWISGPLLHHKLLDQASTKLFQIVETPQEAVAILQKYEFKNG